MIGFMYHVIRTEKELLEALSNINSYLDELKAQGKKQRLGVDTETCLSEEARAYYDLQHSLRKQTKKQKEAGELIMLHAPEYPIPTPFLNKRGIREGLIRLLQIGLDPKYCDLQYVFDLFDIFEDYKQNVYESDLVDIYQFYLDIGALFRPLFERASLLGQFLGYEASFFIEYFGIFVPEWRDLYVMSRIIWNGGHEEHSLGWIYERTMNEEFFLAKSGKTFEAYIEFKKVEQKSQWWGELTDTQYGYAADDVTYLFYSFDKMYEMLEKLERQYDTGRPDTGIMTIVKDNCDLINIVALGENVGFPFNEEVYFDKVKPRLEKAMQEAQDAVDSEYGQRTRVKVEKLKRVKGKGKDREIVHIEREKEVVQPYKLAYHDDIRALTKLDKSVLDKTGGDDLIFFKDFHPAVPHIIRYKKAQKCKSYFESDNIKSRPYVRVADSLGFIHPSFDTVGTETLRFTCQKPNLQQVPGDEDIRACFQPPEGWDFIIFDISAAEPRLTGQETRDKFYLDCFLNNKDMHWETAKYVFNAPEEYDSDNPTHKKLRKRSKVMRLGKTYMMGFDKYIKKLYVDSEGDLDFAVRGEEGRKEAKAKSDAMDSLSPGVQAYIEWLQNDVEKVITHHPSRSMARFKNGDPIYVSCSIGGAIRKYVLEPHEKADAKAKPHEWHWDHKVKVKKPAVYDEEGNLIEEAKEYWSTRKNKAQTKVRDIARQAFNSRMQSSQADGIKKSVIECWKEILKAVENKTIANIRDCVMINWVHDEIIFMCRSRYSETMAPILKEAIQRGFRKILWDETIPVVVGGGVCRTWAEKD